MRQDVVLTNIFSTPVFHLTGKKEEVKGLKDWALKWERKDHNKEEYSNRGGYHSTNNQDYNSIPNVSILKNKLGFLPEHTLGNWWINIQRKGDYNVTHNHPRSDLSFIWYVTDNYNSLVFVNYQNEMMRNRLLSAFKTKDLFEYQFKWNCKAGDVLIFPSDTLHYTRMHDLRTPRISISGNLILKV